MGSEAGIWTSKLRLSFETGTWTFRLIKASMLGSGSVAGIWASGAQGQDLSLEAGILVSKLDVGLEARIWASRLKSQ